MDLFHRTDNAKSPKPPYKLIATAFLILGSMSLGLLFWKNSRNALGTHSGLPDHRSLSLTELETAMNKVGFTSQKATRPDAKTLKLGDVEAVLFDDGAVQAQLLSNLESPRQLSGLAGRVVPMCEMLTITTQNPLAEAWLLLCINRCIKKAESSRRVTFSLEDPFLYQDQEIFGQHRIKFECRNFDIGILAEDTSAQNSRILNPFRNKTLADISALLRAMEFSESIETTTTRKYIFQSVVEIEVRHVGPNVSQLAIIDKSAIYKKQLGRSYASTAAEVFELTGQALLAISGSSEARICYEEAYSDALESMTGGKQHFKTVPPFSIHFGSNQGVVVVLLDSEFVILPRR